MIRAVLLLIFVLLLFAVACTRHTSGPTLVIEIPAGFNGNFVLNMGVHQAPSLQKNGEGYVVTVPRNGRIETSTMLEHPKVVFRNGTSHGIWGYSESTFATGDGISTGGKVQFFVGTQKDFEAEQNKRNKSGAFPGFEPVTSGV
jgi:hypothetical protein